MKKPRGGGVFRVAARLRQRGPFVTFAGDEMVADAGSSSTGSKGYQVKSWRRGRTHGLHTMRRTLGQLTTKRLDGRSAVAVAVRTWKADVRRDLGGNLSRAQETILEATAQAWVILSSLDDYIARQPSLVTRKRALLPVVRERMAIADSLARNLERLGLERRVKVNDVDVILQRLRGGTEST